MYAIGSLCNLYHRKFNRLECNAPADKVACISYGIDFYD